MIWATPIQYQPTTREWISAPARVIRVIPQHLLTMIETIPADGSTGGISPGFHTVMFNEHGGKTTVTAVLEHAGRLPKGTTEAEAVSQSPWGPDKFNHGFATAKWQTEFVPYVRKLVAAEKAKKK